MNKEKILEDIQSLIQDIDKCNRKFRRSSSNGNTEAFVKSLYEIERILPAVHQELNFLYEYIKGLWKDAQGDDIPEIDREVVALVGLEDNDYKVVFAHRVNIAGYNGKSLITGKTIRYVPKGYDKGGWNQPNVRFWLDLELPVKEGGKDEQD